MTALRAAPRPSAGPLLSLAALPSDPVARQILANLPEWEARVRLLVKPRRYEHVQRVAVLAGQIAAANGLSEVQVAQAYAAGILHDIARDLPDSELLRLAPPECEIDSQHPLALHGRAARTLLEHWGYAEQVVLDAIEDHTTGPRGNAAVSACVYIADVSEPGRGVNDDIRALALGDIQAALNRAIVSKVTYLQGKGIQVHPRTLRCYEALSTPSAAPQWPALILPSQSLSLQSNGNKLGGTVSGND